MTITIDWIILDSTNSHNRYHRTYHTEHTLAVLRNGGKKSVVTSDLPAKKCGAKWREAAFVLTTRRRGAWRWCSVVAPDP